MASVSSRLQQQLLKVLSKRETLKQCLSTSSILSYRRKQFMKKQKNCKSLVQSERESSTLSTDTDTENKPSPFRLVESELSTLSDDIRKKMKSDKEELGTIAQYFFDGKGKLFRPMVVMLMAQSVNSHYNRPYSLLSSQREVAMIAEMIHTASLVHDDVIDGSDTRRGKPTVHQQWGHRKAILAGDYILSVASMALARLQNEEVVCILSQVIEDLVRGEFMQLGSKEDEDERFAHYLKKTYKKTASLIACSCQAVAVLGSSSEDVAAIAYQYGRNLGMAFQLIDDILDFTSCDHVMGKPTAADLRLGLATAPVLFAAQEYSELNSMIMRRFSQDGDVERARECVAKSNGVYQARLLAEGHSREAKQQIEKLSNSPSKEALWNICEIVLNRQK